MTNGLIFHFFDTEWGRAVSVVSIRLENGLSPDRRQAISQTIADLFRVEPPGTFFIEIIINQLTFLLKVMRWKCLWRVAFLSRHQYSKYICICMRVYVYCPNLMMYVYCYLIYFATFELYLFLIKRIWTQPYTMGTNLRWRRVQQKIIKQAKSVNWNLNYYAKKTCVGQHGISHDNNSMRSFSCTKIVSASVLYFVVLRPSRRHNWLERVPQDLCRHMTYAYFY